MFIFNVGSDEVRVRTDAEFQCLNDDEKISYVWNDLWPDDLGMTWIEKVLYDHDTGDLGLPEIWDQYVSENKYLQELFLGTKYIKVHPVSSP